MENVFWEEGKAPSGTYQVYVHHYKKHQKRRSKDPTKFQVIVTPGGEPLEYNGELSAGDPIMLVAEFTLPSPEEREARKQELEAELRAAQGLTESNSPAEVDSVEEEPAAAEETVDEETVDEEPVAEEAVSDASEEEKVDLPEAPDLDALSEE